MVSNTATYLLGYGFESFLSADSENIRIKLYLQQKVPVFLPKSFPAPWSRHPLVWLHVTHAVEKVLLNKETALAVAASFFSLSWYRAKYCQKQTIILTAFKNQIGINLEYQIKVQISWHYLKSLPKTLIHVVSPFKTHGTWGKFYIQIFVTL
jgi:hypothetical protein